MKIIRFLFAITLLCGAAGIARADAVDFRMNVLDPNHGLAITSQNFVVTFVTCTDGVPAGVSAGGCFYGRNMDPSKTTWTSLNLTFPKIGAIQNQPAGCAPIGGGVDIFTNASCGSNGSQFNLVYFGGPGIKYEEYFLIIEYDPTNPNNPNAFPSGTLGFNQVPEPSSIALLSTGTLMVGLFLLKRRKPVSTLSAL